MGNPILDEMARRSRENPELVALHAKFRDNNPIKRLMEGKSSTQETLDVMRRLAESFDRNTEVVILMTRQLERMTASYDRMTVAYDRFVDQVLEGGVDDEVDEADAWKVDPDGE